jgi:hypothetical protein
MRLPVVFFVGLISVTTVIAREQDRHRHCGPVRYVELT